MSAENKYHIFISVADPSADSHCAGLIKSLKAAGLEFEFRGVGGTQMASEGCKLMEMTTCEAAMIYNAFWRVFYFYKLLRKIRRYFREQKPDLVIVCDSPAFNFHVAQAAKKAGIKTLFYVAPQLWAWGAWRIRKLRKYCDKLACILPFEQQWFTKRGIDAVFVGNPLLDEHQENRNNEQTSYQDFEAVNATIALMPGSRKAEIKSLWEPMQRAAIQIQERYPSVVFYTIAVDEDKRQILQAGELPAFSCEYTIGLESRTLLQTDLALVASGSATLQLAAAGIPMLVLYQSSRILWHLLGRWLVKSKFLSLVNILAQKELVPEFMPYFSSAEPVASKALELLSDKEQLQKLSSELKALTEPLAEKQAGEQTTNLVLDLLRQ